MNPSMLIEPLGWALIHSLWQIALVGGLAALGLRWAGSSRPKTQYAIAMGALVSCLFLSALTFALGLLSPQTTHVSPTAPLQPMIPAPFPVAHTLGELPWTLRIQRFLGARLMWVTLLWGLGVSIMALRLGGAWFTARRWRTSSEAMPPVWATRMAALASQMGLGLKVALRGSRRIATPMAMGLWRPMVLMPISLLARLPEPYLEALVAHELAHIRRHDYLFNLLQSIVEVLLFHHPIVWWLSRKVRTLREHLCDDLAAQVLGEPRRLALALDALDDLLAIPVPNHPTLALAARGGPLFARIHRLLVPPRTQPRPGWLPTALLALALPCTAFALRAAAHPPIPADPHIVQELDALAAQEGIDPHLLRAMAFVESACQRNVVSSMGALGVLQVLPTTAQRFGAQNVQDPHQVAAAGARYLHHLLDRYQGDTAKAVAAYNGGEEAIDAGRLSAETLAYQAKVLDLHRQRIVQPAQPLDNGWVDGVLQTYGDGKWVIAFRISHKGNLQVDMFDLQPDGTPGKSLGSIVASDRIATPETPWHTSEPTIQFEAPAPSSVLIRVRDTTLGIVGETKLKLNGSIQTFAIRMEAPKA